MSEERKYKFRVLADDTNPPLTDPDPHHLLQQLPLTISPYLSLPTAVPLPYSYKQLPSTLPPSATDPLSTSQGQMDASAGGAAPAAPPQPHYVVSQSGHSAHPDHIIASCRALQAHLQQLQDDARATIAKWDADLRARDLAEKRRVAPGWLDVADDERLLVPLRVGAAAAAPEGALPRGAAAGAERMELDGRGRPGDEGEELDRAFGGLAIR